MVTPPLAKKARRRHLSGRHCLRRKVFRGELRREAANLLLFRVAQAAVDGGLSWGMVARLMCTAPSWLFRLNKLYRFGGYAAIAPNLVRVFPSLAEAHNLGIAVHYPVR